MEGSGQVPLFLKCPGTVTNLPSVLKRLSAETARGTFDYVWTSSCSGHQGTKVFVEPPGVQNVGSSQGEGGHHCRGLVCHHRPQGCVLPDTHCWGHWCFLRFGFKGIIFKFRVLTFGISLAPWTFTRCMDEVLASFASCRAFICLPWVSVVSCGSPIASQAWPLHVVGP